MGQLLAPEIDANAPSYARHLGYRHGHVRTRASRVRHEPCGNSTHRGFRRRRCAGRRWSARRRDGCDRLRLWSWGVRVRTRSSLRRIVPRPMRLLRLHGWRRSDGWQRRARVQRNHGLLSAFDLVGCRRPRCRGFVCVVRRERRCRIRLRSRDVHRRTGLRLLLRRHASQLFPDERCRGLPSRIHVLGELPQLGQPARLQRADAAADTRRMHRHPHLVRRNADVCMLSDDGVSGR